MQEARSSASRFSSLEDDLALLLAHVWRQFYAVQGKKIRGRNPLDVFQHRVKVASYQPTFPRFLEKLAHGLGLQSLAVPGDLIERVARAGRRAVEVVREESVFLVARAYNIARNLRNVEPSTSGGGGG